MAGDTINTGRLAIAVNRHSQHVVHTLVGQIDERCDLQQLVAESGDAVVINLSQVSFINSIGVREWIRLLQAYRDKHISVKLTECSEALVQQMNMIVDAKGAATVESFYAPYECEACGYEASMLLEMSVHRAVLLSDQPPYLACPECSEMMELNDLPERYLQFMKYY